MNLQNQDQSCALCHAYLFEEDDERIREKELRVTVQKLL